MHFSNESRKRKTNCSWSLTLIMQKRDHLNLLDSWLSIYCSALKRWFLKHTGWIPFLHLPHIVLDLFLLSLVEHTIQFFSLFPSSLSTTPLIISLWGELTWTIWCLEFTTITANQNQCGNASPLISSTACFSMHTFIDSLNLLDSWLNIYCSALQRWFLKHTGWIPFLHLSHIGLDLFLLSLVEHTEEDEDKNKPGNKKDTQRQTTDTQHQKLKTHETHGPRTHG
jgi:hypothetical protein